MIFKIFGIILIIDGILSLFLPLDKHWKWQIGRIIRILIGICLLFIVK